MQTDASGSIAPSLQVVIESTFNWYWIVDLLQDHQIDVKLAHPLHLKAIAYAKVKTDRVDAHTLAQLLTTGWRYQLSKWSGHPQAV
jgi:transposase